MSDENWLDLKDYKDRHIGECWMTSSGGVSFNFDNENCSVILGDETTKALMFFISDWLTEGKK